MSDETVSLPTASCAVCGQETLSKTATCSFECSNGRAVIFDLTEMIRHHKVNHDDTRVFYHDLGFADLVNLFCVTVLRRMRQPAIKDQNTSNSLLCTLEKSVMTKFNKQGCGHGVREAICKLVTQIFNLNATQWRLRCIVASKTNGVEESAAAAMAYLAASDIKLQKMRELDMLVMGRSTIPDGRLYA